MSVYFNARTLYALGMDQPTVKMFEELYKRSGGSSTVTLNASDIEIMLESIASKAQQITTLQARISELQGALSETRTMSNRALESRVEALESSTSTVSFKNIESRLDALEALSL